MDAILVVSRNAAMSFGLTATYDVQDIRPDRFGEWSHRVGEVAAVVLELEDPVAASSAILQLREGRQAVPILVVSSSRPGWELLTEAYPAVRVVPLPVSRARLMDALAELISAGPATGEQIDEFLKNLPTPSAETVSQPEPAPPVEVDDTIESSGLGWPAGSVSYST